VTDTDEVEVLHSLMLEKVSLWSCTLGNFELEVLR